MHVQIDFPFLFVMLAAAYVVNVAIARELSSDRLLLRAPIVAVFTTVVYGYLTLALGWPFGALAFVLLLVHDVTPGKAMGKHA